MHRTRTRDPRFRCRRSRPSLSWGARSASGLSGLTPAGRGGSRKGRRRRLDRVWGVDLEDRTVPRASPAAVCTVTITHAVKVVGRLDGRPDQQLPACCPALSRRLGGGSACEPLSSGSGGHPTTASRSSSPGRRLSNSAGQQRASRTPDRNTHESSELVARHLFIGATGSKRTHARSDRGDRRAPAAPSVATLQDGFAVVSHAPAPPRAPHPTLARSYRPAAQSGGGGTRPHRRLTGSVQDHRVGSGRKPSRRPVVVLEWRLARQRASSNGSPVFMTAKRSGTSRRASVQMAFVPSPP